MYVSLFIVAAFFIVPQTLAEELIINDASAEKRAPMGFQGMRGKKDITSNSEENELSKRAPMGFQGMRGKKDPIGPDLDEIADYAYEKRGPMGFHGTRGKKDDYLASDVDEGFYHEDYEKRAPMGFQGMRGKKAMLEDEFYKRAMMGFGMRGKKPLDEILGDLETRAELQGIANKLYMNEYPDEYEKRAVAMGFQGMRGKKDGLENVAEWEKRAATMGFHGTRGKKNFLEELEDLEKRTAMGIQQMGDKKYDIDNNNYYEYVVEPSDYEKRAPMGFQGMRGKKDEYKRGSMGFVGMRGKRNVVGIYDINDGYHERPKDLQDSRLINNGLQFNKRAQYGFFGMRGKKIPRWEIRGKFVGVRGKKWAPNQDNVGNSMTNRFGSVERINSKPDLTSKFNNQ